VQSPMLAAALAYAARGWQVIPLHWPVVGGGCSCRAAGCPSPGKHPMIARWEWHASTDRETLRSWWGQLPQANVGIAVGTSGLVVIDLDGPEGLRSLEQLQTEHGRLPSTLQVRTGGGGMHLYYRDGGYKTPCRARLRPKLDIRGDGGMIVAPPSLHKSSRRYQVLSSPRELPELPYWMRRLIKTSPRYSDADRLRLRQRLPLEGRPKVNYLGLGDPSELAARIRAKLMKGR
jgi:hypothetical protein